MAAPTTHRFGKGIFYVESSTPGTYTKICGFTSAELIMNTDLADTVVPDCDAPDTAAWTARDAVSQSWSMSFDGVLAKEATELLEGEWLSGTSSNVRWRIVDGGTGSGTPDRQYAGAGFITLGIAAERGTRMTRTVSVQSDGALTITNVAAL
jgi:hypothetical protein